MSQIQLDTIKLIVEKNMRDSGLSGGVMENGWKDSIQIDPTNPASSIDTTFNLQKLRDIISKSILDILTNTQATGTSSFGNISGNQIIVKDASEINITKNNPLLSKKAARITDTTKIDIISDPIFLAWIITVTAVINGLVPGSITPASNNDPTVTGKILGKITSGSDTVKIGD